MSARIIMRLQVLDLAHSASSVKVITLCHPRRPTLPPWSSGAHVDVHVPGGKIRQYSLCGDPNDLSTYRIAVKYEAQGRGGSRWIHEDLRRGDIIPVSAPRNHFPLDDQASHNVFVAGGIGITPIYSMAHESVRNGTPFDLYYCVRSRVDAALLSDLEEICRDRLQLFVSSERRLDTSEIFQGRNRDTHIYSCGPKRLTESVRTSALAHGMTEEQLHSEIFEPEFDENFKPEPFDVTVASTGDTFRVPSEQTMLDVLRDHGYPMPSSCELGVCGACVCNYLDGVVIHRDSVLSPVDRQSEMTPCISRARGSVTIDL